MRTRGICVRLLTISAIAGGLVSAEEPARLDLEWVFGDEARSITAVPDHTWLDTGWALLYDKLPPKGERTLETLDPATGTRRKLIDAAKALKSLTELMQPEEPLEELDWPSAIDTRGRWAAYEKDDDIFVLDLQTSEFFALADTDAEEKSPRFAPDGTQVAFVRDSDLYVFDLEAKEEKRVTTTGSRTLLNGTLSWVYWEEVFGRSDRGYSWSPDSRSIVYLETDESGVGVVTFVDFKPNVPKVIQQRYPKTGEANPRVRAGVVEIDSGETTWIDLGVYPYEYLVRAEWLPDGKRVAVQTLDRSQTKLDLFLADAEDGSVRHVLRETDEGWVNLHDDLYFLDAGRFLWASERDGYNHLYVYDAEGKAATPVTKGEWAVRASASVFWLRQTVPHIDEENDWIYFTALEKSSIEKHLYRIRMDGTRMKRLSRQDGTHSVKFSKDGNYYLDAHSAMDRLPALTLHSADGKRLHTVWESRGEPLELFDLPPRELFEIETEDGFKMPATMVKPRDFDAKKKYPVVIYVYGGPSAPTVGNAWGSRPRDYFEQILAEEGFIALRVDNRSATARSKKLENLILNEGYGTTELSDLLEAVKWLKARPFVDPERVGIWGWSGGGSFTLLALTSSKEFRAGIAVAAVTDWHYYDTKWAEAFMKRPQDNPDGYVATSHAERAKELHGRLLLVHGTNDDNVHPQNAWRFADELIDAGITFDMMIYPMRKHGIRDDPAQKHLYATMMEFWKRNLR